MKFFIAVDCEGSACVVGEPGKSLGSSWDYKFACKETTLEADICARALFDSGAEEVYIWDCHGEGVNLDYEKLDTRCRIIMGKGHKQRLPGIDGGFSGLLMIGYHSMEGTDKGVLSHTYSSNVYKSIRLNGVEAGEILLDSSVAGEFQVPLIFLAGDDKACEEALKFMPWVETVATKKGVGINTAICKHPDLVKEEIYFKVKKSIENLDKVKPVKVKNPIIEIEFKSFLHVIKALIKRRRGWSLKSFKSISKRLNSMKEWNC